MPTVTGLSSRRPMALQALATALALAAVIVAASNGISGLPVVLLALGTVVVEVAWAGAVHVGRAGSVSAATMALVVAASGTNALVLEYPGPRMNGLAAPLLLVGSSLVASVAAASWRWSGEALARLCSRPTSLVLWCLASLPALAVVHWRGPLAHGGPRDDAVAFLAALLVLGLAVAAVVDHVSFPAVLSGVAAMAALSLSDIAPPKGTSLAAGLVLGLITAAPFLLLVASWAWAEAAERGRSSPRLTGGVVIATVIVAVIGPVLIMVAMAVLAALVGQQRLGDRWRVEAWSAARRPWVWGLYGWFGLAISFVITAYWRVPGLVPYFRFSHPVGQVFAALAPVLGLLALTLGDVDVCRDPGRRVEVRFPRWLLAGATVLVIGVAVVGITSQWQRNDDPHVTDQGAYITYARDLRNDPEGIVADRNRMPLYPYLLSQMIDADGSVASAMKAGKALGVVIGAVGAVAVGAWLWRRVEPVGALAGFSALVLSVVMFKAPAVQADLGVFFLLLASAVCSWRVLRTPTVMRGAVAGAVLGLTQLTKSNASIMLVLLVLIGSVAAALPRSWSGLSVAARRAMPLALVSVVGVFLAVMAPYFVNSSERFGDPLFNANSTYYIWYDTWPEADAALPAHEDPAPSAPAPEPVPSWGRYFDRHTPGDALARFRSGFAVQYERSARAYGFLGLLELALLAGAAAFAVAPRRPRPGLRAPMAFGLVVVTAYLTFTAWWMALVQGERFVLLMFLPVLALSLVVVERFGRERWLVWRGRSMQVATLLFTGLLLVVLLEVPALLHAAFVVGGAE